MANLRKEWSACATGGVVTMELELADTDEAIQDYVIVRNLRHLMYKSHGRRLQAMDPAPVPHCRELERQCPHGRHAPNDEQVDDNGVSE